MCLSCTLHQSLLSGASDRRVLNTIQYKLITLWCALCLTHLSRRQTSVVQLRLVINIHSPETLQEAKELVLTSVKFDTWQYVPASRKICLTSFYS